MEYYQSLLIALQESKQITMEPSAGLPDYTSGEHPYPPSFPTIPGLIPLCVVDGEAVYHDGQGELVTKELWEVPGLSSMVQTTLELGGTILKIDVDGL